MLCHQTHHTGNRLGEAGGGTNAKSLLDISLPTGFLRHLRKKLPTSQSLGPPSVQLPVMRLAGFC